MDKQTLKLTAGLEWTIGESMEYDFKQRDAPRVTRAWERVAKEPFSQHPKRCKVWKRHKIKAMERGIDQHFEMANGLRGVKRQKHTASLPVQTLSQKYRQYSTTLHDQVPGTPRRKATRCQNLVNTKWGKDEYVTQPPDDLKLSVRHEGLAKQESTSRMVHLDTTTSNMGLTDYNDAEASLEPPWSQSGSRIFDLPESQPLAEMRLSSLAFHTGKESEDFLEKVLYRSETILSTGLNHISEDTTQHLLDSSAINELDQQNIDTINVHCPKFISPSEHGAPIRTVESRLKRRTSCQLSSKISVSDENTSASHMVAYTGDSRGCVRVLSAIPISITCSRNVDKQNNSEVMEGSRTGPGQALITGIFFREPLEVADSPPTSKSLPTEDLEGDISENDNSTLEHGNGRNWKTRSSARYSDNTSMLKDFLNRAQARKAIQYTDATIDTPIGASTRYSQRKVLGRLDNNSPSRIRSRAKSRTKPQELANRPGTPHTNPPPGIVGMGDIENEPNAVSLSCRRSTRTRFPVLPKPSLAAPSLIPVRRANELEPVVLKRSEARELALVTQANTKRNKGKAKMPSAMLPVLAVETREAATGQVMGKTGKARSGKCVDWDRKLVYFQETITTVAGKEENAAMRRNMRNVEALGAVNGTPARKRLGGS